MRKTRKHFIASVALGMVLLNAGHCSATGENPARARLVAAVKATRELGQRAREGDGFSRQEPQASPNGLAEPKRCFSSSADVKIYREQREWCQEYVLTGWPRNPSGLKQAPWPHGKDAPSLRELLSDPDPALRGLAAEALGTLHDPDDVPRIAKMLDDDTESVPVLGDAPLYSANVIPGTLKIIGQESMDISRMWKARRVSDYAHASLKIMTGEDIDASKFTQWWETQHGGRDRVWYWQELLHRDLTLAEALTREELNQTAQMGDAWQTRYNEAVSAKFNAVRASVARQLEQLPVEVEAKVRLFALNRYSSVLNLPSDVPFDSAANKPLMGRFQCPRISSERLMELLEQKNRWTDVKWDTGARDSLVNQIVEQADRFFGRKDVERLRSIKAQAEKNPYELWDTGRASLIIGIAKLLPPARADDMENPDTMEGVLREGVRQSTEEFIRGVVARELMRVGLIRNWELLTDQFWRDRTKNGDTDLRTRILEGLYEQPLTEDKRKCLASLLLDARFDPLWVENKGRAGSDQHRQRAFRAVNAFAGREALHESGDHDYQLADPQTTPKMLKKVKGIVREVLLQKD